MGYIFLDPFLMYIYKGQHKILLLHIMSFFHHIYILTRFFSFLFVLRKNLCLVPSLETYFDFLHHSVSMYEIACRWPWELYIFAIFLAILVLWITYVHISYMYQHNILLSR